MTVIVPFTSVCGVMTFIWPFLNSKAGYIIVSIIYGLESQLSFRLKCHGTLITDKSSLAQGGFVSLLPVPVVGMGDIQDLGRRLGISMALISIGVVVGPPISGAIYTSTGGYEAVGYYAGEYFSGGGVYS